MPTEPWDIPFAPRRAVRIINPLSQYKVCEGIIAALQDAGWSVVDATRAGWSLVFPWGPPHTVEPSPPIPDEDKRLVTWGYHALTINGAPVCYYDQYREKPDPANPKGVIWVEMSTMPRGLGGLEALLVQLGWSRVGSRILSKGYYRDWMVIDWEYATPGLEANDADYGGSVDIDAGTMTHIWTKGATWFSPSAGPAGGGYTLRSAAQGTGWLQVWVGIPDQNMPRAMLRFEASTGGEKPVRTLQSRKDTFAFSGEYQIIANPYQFLVFLKGRKSPADGGYYNQVLATLVRPDPNKGVHYSAVVAGVGSFRTTFQWEGGTAAAALNGGFSAALTKPDMSFQGTFPGLYMVKFPYPLRTPAGSPVLQQAWIGCPQDAGEGARNQARIVGRLWDAVIVGEHYPIDSQAKIGNRLFQCVGNEERYLASRCSLWVVAEDEGQEN